MTIRRFRQVDVFGATPYAGNPVAVVLDADGLAAEEMRQIAAWTNLSECTFVLPPRDPGADYRVRIFSLRTELSFAGHPTLGTARAWLDVGGIPRDPTTIVQECGIGQVPVAVEDALLSFAAPALVRGGPVEPGELAEILAVLGVGGDDVVDAAWIDNGPGWVGVLLASADAVLALRPDVSGRTRRFDIGVIGPHPAGAEAAWEVRAFFTDGSGPLREDPVTGSLNASAAQWLIATRRATAPYRVRQGTRLGRRGDVHITVHHDRLWVGGSTFVAVRGEIVTA